MKKAIVTLAVGKRFSRMVRDYCHSNWKMYAEKHGYPVYEYEQIEDFK